MPDFHDRLRDIMERRSISSSELSRRMGRKASYISNLIREGSDPKLSTLQSLASILDCSIDELGSMGPLYSVEAEAGHKDRISAQVATLFHRTVNEEFTRIDDTRGNSLLDKFSEFWLEQGGVLTDTSRFTQFVDIYHAPEPGSGRVKLFKMGPQSASAETLKMTSTDQLNKQLENLSPDVTRALESAQTLALETRKPMFDIVKLDIRTAEGPMSVVYRRLYTPWKDKQNRQYVINTSQRVRVKVKNPKMIEAVTTPDPGDWR